MPEPQQPVDRTELAAVARTGGVAVALGVGLVLAFVATTLVDWVPFVWLPVLPLASLFGRGVLFVPGTVGCSACGAPAARGVFSCRECGRFDLGLTQVLGTVAFSLGVLPVLAVIVEILVLFLTNLAWQSDVPVLGWLGETWASLPVGVTVSLAVVTVLNVVFAFVLAVAYEGIGAVRTRRQGTME